MAQKHAPSPPSANCPWCGVDPLYVGYHDREWGRPCRDERKMFEFLVLEAAQSGLSWITILRKREGYRAAFDGFDPEKIALYGEQDFARLMADASIVRNKLKIASAISNAKAALALREKGRSLGGLFWSRVGGAPKVNMFESPSPVPASTPESEDASKELKALGFKHVGPIVAYSHMQAMGVVDDHLVSCPQHTSRRAPPA